MATSRMSGREPVRLNDLDWKILHKMADGKRYTQSYIARDLPEFEDESYDWVRQRVSNLHGHGLIEKVGTSDMYTISELGRAALELQDEYEADKVSPVEFGDKVRELKAKRQSE
jgi:DNA-binding Lrp family transcriptional regulator